jgi:adenosylcobinamide-GDP ribazoletransferase
MMVGALRLALQFLTKLPVRSDPPTARDIAQSYYFYPIIGLFIGLVAILLRFVLAIFFPMPFCIVLVLAFLIWVTGGLHEDGLADVADGMAGGWTTDERLRIMKDSHIGAFGAMALALMLLIKYSALTSMNPLQIDNAMISGQLLARWAFLPLGYFNFPAREGLGSRFIKGIGNDTLIITSVLTSTIVIVLSPLRGAIAFCVAGVVVAALSAYFRRRLGGITGDCFGATFQFVEIATYVVFLA